ncbi:hypothetical protein Tco_1346474 [Tanacetum coccineum]
MFLTANRSRTSWHEVEGRLVRYGMMIGKKKRLYYGAVVSNRQRGITALDNPFDVFVFNYLLFYLFDPLEIKGCNKALLAKHVSHLTQVARMINLHQAAFLPKRAIQCTISPSLIFIFASSLSSLTVRPTIGDTTDADLLKSTRELG